METRTYAQHEPLARSLDLLGDRWTLLILREILLGPRRWTDILSNLPGIGKNLLAARLRHLEEGGLAVRHALPWVSGRTAVYELGERGKELLPVILELMRWGLPLLHEENEPPERRPEWALLATMAAARPRRALEIEVTVDGEPFTLTVRRGRVWGRRGLCTAPDLRQRAATADLYDLTRGRVRSSLRTFAAALGIA